VRGISMRPGQTRNSGAATSCTLKRPISPNRKPSFGHFRPMFGCNKPTWRLRELKGNSVIAAEVVKPTDIGTWTIFEVVRQRS
jgi:hypothetical protein